ncbi:MAG: peptide chain release factor 2 [Desulfovibrionales bacterium]|nr:peptide chain release factor 2 [Desulfovibrionales bacterium]
MSMELKSRIADLKAKLEQLRGHLDLDNKTERLRELDKIMAQNDFWGDSATAAAILKERAAIQAEIGEWRASAEDLEETEVLLELAIEEDDKETARESEKKLLSLEKAIEQAEFNRMLRGEHDRSNAIMSINSGAGGTEAQDWTQMLLRMYTMWTQSKGYQLTVIDILPGDEAGVKNVTLTVAGPYAYGYLKAEIGVHRLVRISPFDASGRRHTSFASVSVLPELDETIAVEINEADLRIDTYRASGAGGQHVNKTSSAVRITHIPTGIVVQCQNERSQHKNKATAMKILRARLYEREKAIQDKKKQEIHDGKKEIAWGNQIRSYILQPYRLIKDHRTNLEIGNVDAVLNGDLDPFISAFLLKGPQT